MRVVCKNPITVVQRRNKGGFGVYNRGLLHDTSGASLELYRPYVDHINNLWGQWQQMKPMEPILTFSDPLQASVDLINDLLLRDTTVWLTTWRLGN